MESVENGGTLSDRGKPAERSVEDLSKSPSSYGSTGMSRAARALTVRYDSPAKKWCSAWKVAESSKIPTRASDVLFWL